MADAVVEFLLQNIKELLLYHADLIYGLHDQVESLHKELSLMKAFLKDSRDKHDESEYVREVVRQITDVAYEAEDIIDAFVVNASIQKRSTIRKVMRAFDNASLLRNVGREIESIRVKVKEIYDKKMFGIVSMARSEPVRKHSREKRPPLVEEANNVVGFDEETKIVIDRLTRGSKHLEVVSVIGMGGLGKTTLARKVYVDPSIEYHFYLRAWVYMSQEYSRREVFRAILESLGLINDQMLKMSDDWLGEELCRHLRNNRFLIVIDDVWTREAWDDIRAAFPNTNSGSRVLLTSRNREVALHANPDGPPHNLRFLTDDESWELLCRKTFRKECCPPELDGLGKQIAKKCYGLPLAIVVISGLLLKKEKTHDWWKKVADSVSTYVAKDPKQCMDVLALSYNHLPDHLKVCFIYFGVFPEDFEIPVWKLLRLWVAEGFVQENGQECLEDLAEEYLEDLVDRNLVLVAKMKANGQIKTCRIHDMLRDLCVKEGAEQKSLQVIKGRPFLTSMIQSNYHRRLCIHSNVLDFISSKPVGRHVRSFLCFVSEDTSVPRQYTSFVGETFRLVRVLDLRSVNFPRFPNEIVHLIHLRFIALYGNFKILPAAIANLWNLQTIIIWTTCRELDILADIWKMLQFRHLHTNGISTLRGPPAQTRKNYEDPFVRRNILTISTISPDSCTENVLARTPNLRKLAIRGRIVKLVEEKGGFDVLAKLDRLESLKLINDAFPLDPSRCIVTGLPPSYKFPPSLKKVTLSDTLLGWDHMSTLGMLPNLEVLKLRDYAFKGSHWEPLDGGFRLLRVLQIGRTDLVRWDARGHHFPRLQRVVFRLCSSLEAVPAGLAEVAGLQSMELYWPKTSAACSARSIRQRKLKMQQEMGLMKDDAFKLLIYPPDI
ncbi:putative late blight resistance protein homolog r1b-14 [Phtheirospermum japonicum]|uniref:Putative late blight resistance protein homolog r1b-14 n=1 Tax=Phtheirospermum japonicum TaxID=374723 RepID=A0A830BI83_9LAMI|nr:putative late blight resistance protein homolog r1b-14 [Phtheirospermum japonicum]